MQLTVKDTAGIIEKEKKANSRVTFVDLIAVVTTYSDVVYHYISMETGCVLNFWIINELRLSSFL